MFQRILVPVDLTDKNARAIAQACDLASRGSSQVTMLHIIETLDVPFEELEDFYTRLEQNAADRMGALSKPLRDAGVPVTEQVAYGKRAPEIVRYAHENQFDLIVLSSHRIDPDHPAESWMTISHQVALLAPIPVLLLK